MLLTFFSTVTMAADNSCPGIDEGPITSGTSVSYVDTLKRNTTDHRYHYIDIPSAGNVTITIESILRTYQIDVGSSCGASDYGSQKSNSTRTISHTVASPTGERIFLSHHTTTFGNNNLREFRVTVNFVSTLTPPSANNGTVTTKENTPLNFDINDHATDDDNIIGVQLVAIPPVSEGSVIVSTTSPLVTFTPALNFTGITQFDYQVIDNDNLNSNTATIDVNVTPNQPPIANDKNYTIVEGVTFSGNVITDNAPTRDSDPDGDSLTVSGHTTLSDPTPINTITGPDVNGAFTVTANTGFDGSSVTFDYNVTDGYGGVDTATITLNIIAPYADLQISKSGPASVDIGEAMSYTLNVSNLSSSTADAQNVVVTDTLPSGFIYNGYSAPAGWSCALGASLTCTASTLSVGASGNIIINGYAPVTAGDINNTASISSDTSDPDSSNNDSNVVITTVNDVSADLVMTKTSTPSPDVITASPLDYTLSVRNDGSGDASAVQVTDSLDANLFFVSVDPGTDWSCSQGQLIVCDYTANGGVLASGATAGDITIRVTTPAQPGVVDNTASVSTSTYDTDTSNNTDTISVTVIEGTNTGGSYPLEKYLQYNLFGDMKLIGNANVNFSGTDPNEGYNDNVDMQYVGNSGSFFNNSSSTLTLPDPSYEIVWAGLFWEGHICSDRDNGNGNGSGTGCDWSNSDYNSFNQGKDHLGEVKLKTPDRGSYIDITANNLNIIEKDDTDWTYSAFADITHLIGTHEEGVYSVADIVLTEGQISGGGNYGGWAMLTIYRDPSNNLQYKNISVFKGFQYINSDGNAVDIDGFITPLSGPVTASVAFFAADGDPNPGGVGRMRVGNTTNYNPVGGDAANPTTNLLNSTIAEFGTAINPGVTKTYGVDADRVDVSSFMTNDQRDTRFLFDVSTPSGGVDYYSVTMFAFATDLTTPAIDDINKSAHIVESNGTIKPAGPDVEIYPGSEIVYTLKFENSGEEIAELFEIFDDFDFDGLTPALDLSNFDASKIKLSLPNSTTWQSNPNCGYDSGDNKVWCKIPEVLIGEEYIMEFSVRVRYDLRGLEDENATNTAYANYKNATTDEYVVLVSNSYGNFGGESNTYNAGTFTIPAGWVYSATGMDAINWNYPYNVDNNITTKIVNQEFSLKLVYLNSFGQQDTFVESLGFNMPVLLTLWNDDSIRLIQDGNELPEFSNGDSEIVATQLNLESAHQSDWVKMSFIDWNQLDWDNSGVNCAQKSTLSGNLNGVPQCLSSANQMGNLFPVDEFPYVHNVCLGDDTTQVPSNKDAACYPTAYNSSGSKGNIAPEKYNHASGCLQCLTDSNASFVSRSTDNFAARPDDFVIASSSQHFPDLLRSGSEYNLSIRAEDGANNLTQNYNRSNGDINVSAELYLSDGTLDSAGLLNGTAQKTGNDFNITEGISVAPGTASNEVVEFTFDDVGDVIVNIRDIYWSAVDFDDTPQDCNVTTQTIANGTTRTIEGAAYVCGESNMLTFIPHHFEVSNVLLNNHARKALTYTSNDLNMSAHFDVTITAMNEDNATTLNFSQESGFYENDMNVSLAVNRVHPLGDNIWIKDIPTATSLGFQSGVRTITVEDNNTAHRIMFNYERFNNVPINPFIVDENETSISVESTYTSTATPAAPEGSASITGSELNDQNATFAFARTKSSKFFYDNVLAASVITPISVVVYCDTFPTCTELPDNIEVGGKINEPYWWLSFAHNRATGDGNVTLQKGSVTEGSGPNWDVLPKTVNITTNAVDNTISVSQGAGAVLPLTVEIDLDTTPTTDTNSWLIYNPDSNTVPTPFYRVRFIGQSGWTGHGKTGHVVDSNASKEINKRLSW